MLMVVTAWKSIARIAVLAIMLAMAMMERCMNTSLSIGVSRIVGMLNDPEHRDKRQSLSLSCSPKKYFFL